MQVMYLGRAHRTKETLPDFLKWRRVTRPPLVFRGLTGSQRTPGIGASQSIFSLSKIAIYSHFVLSLGSLGFSVRIFHSLFSSIAFSLAYGQGNQD